MVRALGGRILRVNGSRRPPRAVRVAWSQPVAHIRRPRPRARARPRCRRTPPPPTRTPADANAPTATADPAPATTTRPSRPGRPHHQRRTRTTRRRRHRSGKIATLARLSDGRSRLALSILENRARLSHQTPHTRHSATHRPSPHQADTNIRLAGALVETRTARLATDAGMAIFRHASERWMSDENADHSQLLADSAADLLAISPRICGMTTAQAKSVGGFAEPAGEVVV